MRLSSSHGMAYLVTMRIGLYLLLGGAVVVVANTQEPEITCKDEGFCRMAGGSCVEWTGNTTCNGSNIPNACGTGEDCVCCVNENNCPIGFDRVGENCFKVYLEYAEWDEARQLCKDYGWKLAEPENLDTLVEFIDSKFSGKHIWIGGRGIGRAFNYLSGQLIQGTQPWDIGHPVNTDLEHCLIMRTSLHSNKTTIASCDCYGRYNFICEPYCPEGLIRIGGKCFEVVASSMSWEDSETNCLEEGLRLAEPEDPKKLAERLYHAIGGISYQRDYLWIGARGGQINGSTFAWNSGDPVPIPYPIDNTWRSGYPRDKTSSSCLIIYPYYLSHGPMFEDRCTNSRKSICQWECPLGFFHIGNQCYKAIFSSTTWTEAREMCIHAGGALAEPENPIALREYLFAVTGNRNYWLGGRGDGNRLRWSSGEVVPSSGLKLRSGYSGKKVGMNYCLKVSPQDLVKPLISTNCSTLLYPLCQKYWKWN